MRRRARNPILGRDEELRRVLALLANDGLVTVTGPGGVGKTRLAREVADRWDGPVLFVELDTIETVDAGGVLAAVVEVAGIRTARTALDRDRSTLTPTERLGHELRGRNALVVVDNCEHVLAEAATVVDELADAGDLTVLATSREGLGIDGEQVVPLRPLGGDAVELFVARARAVRPDFEPDAVESAAIAALCERVDGLPLAIELAAARVRTMRPSELLERLDGRPNLLRAPRRSGPAHHTSVTELLDWSLDLLFVAERRLLARLSVFSGSFAIDAAEAVGASAELRREEVVDLLDRLVDKSLLAVEEHPEGTGTHDPAGATRYRLLHLVRSHVATELVGPDRVDATRRHLGHHLALAERANDGVRGPEVGHWVEVLEQEQAELAAALDHAFVHDPDAGITLTARLSWFWFITGRQLELVRRAAQALGARIDGAEAARHPDRSWIASLAAIEGHEPAIPEAIEVAGRVPESLLDALTLIGAGAVCLQQGMTERGTAALRRARAMFVEHDHEWGLGVAAALEGMAQFWTGGLAGAEEKLAVAQDLVRASGDPWQLAFLTSTRADLAIVRGDYEHAEALYEEALASATELRLGHAVVQITNGLADLAILTGRPGDALAMLDDARRHAARVGAQETMVQIDTAMGLALHRLGRREEASATYRSALDKIQPGFKAGESLILCRLADVTLDLGDHAGARDHLQRATALVGNGVDRQRATALVLEGWATLLAAEHRPIAAARALGCAERLRDDAGAPLASGERGAVDLVRCTLERELGAGGLRDELAAGARSTLDAVLDEVCGTGDRVA
ncbi:MAG: hypothetical protein S0880_23940 [Actinomycetota bacterium]|nr:hypothetical protein [Actinomycetota bacterium]